MSMLTHLDEGLCAKALKIVNEASDLRDVAVDLKKSNNYFQ